MSRNATGRLAVLLCVLLLLIVCAALLDSCEKQDDPQSDTSPGTTPATSTEPQIPPLTLGDFCVIRAVKADEKTIDASKKLYSALVAVCGSGVGFTDDFVNRGESPDENVKEILVGVTNRPQSASAQQKIDGYGWCVAVLGNKICIVASDSTLIGEAVEAFIDNCVKKSVNGTIYPEGDILLSKKADIGLNNYAVVLREGRDSYEEEQAREIQSLISATLGCDIALINESDRTYSAKTPEILIGDVVCPEVAELKSTLGVAEYGVFWRGNKIVLFGHSLATTIESTVEFINLLKKNIGYSGGKTTLTEPEHTDIKLRRDDFFTDFPQFESGTLDGTYDCGHSELAYYFSGVDANAVDAYRRKLLDAGYSQYSENTIGNNSFSALTRGDSALYLMYNGTKKRFRVISATTGYMVSSETENDSTAEITLTQMCLDYSKSDVGMSYIITLADGRLVIVDGGHLLTSEADKLMAKLRELSGRSDKPVIAAWIITHTHNDHSGLFERFSELYGKSVTLERLVVNLPSKYTYYNTNHSSFFYPEIERSLGYYATSPRLIIPQTGDIMRLGGIEIEFLYTHIDYYPNNLDVFNDSSTVFRVRAKGQTMLFLGDIQPDAAGVVEGLYGKLLKSDIVQMAHHGYSNGGSKSLYELIDPAIILWPSSPSLYASRSNTGTGAYVIGNLHVKRIVKATEESVTIILPCN